MENTSTPSLSYQPYASLHGGIPQAYLTIPTPHSTKLSQRHMSLLCFEFPSSCLSHLFDGRWTVFFSGQ